MSDAYAVVVTSDQILPDSLPMASLGDTKFLDFLLGRISKAFPDEKKIFCMAFKDFQKMEEAFVKHIESLGFTIFLGDLDIGRRLANMAYVHKIATILHCDAKAPLVSLHFAAEMLAVHRETKADMTLCHNLPGNLAPNVVSVAALSRYNSLINPKMRAYHQLPEVSNETEYQTFMLKAPEYFKVSLFEAPITWRGAGLNTFWTDFTSLALNTQDDLATLRDLIYTVNTDDITIDQVIDYVLIKNMQVSWGRGSEFDTKRIVADQATASSEEGYRKFVEDSINWFIFDDKDFVGGRNLKENVILEVGCGHARLLSAIADRFKEVHGTDITRERYMEARFRLRNMQNAHVTHGDGRSLRQYSENTFDMAYAHGVFVHINSKQIINSYIREMGRVLKPGGKVKFDIYHGTDTFGITPWAFGLGARYQYDELRAVLASAGLKEVSITEVYTRQFFRDPDDGREYSALPLLQLLVVCEK